MNAFQLYLAAFDSACDYKENTVEYIKGYADGAFNINVSDEVAQRILKAISDCEKANDENGQWTNNAYYHVEAPLSEIEL